MEKIRIAAEHTIRALTEALNRIGREVDISTWLQFVAILMGASTIALALMLNSMSPFTYFPKISTTIDSDTGEQLKLIEEEIASQKNSLVEIQKEIQQIENTIQQQGTISSTTNNLPQDIEKKLVEIEVSVSDLNQTVAKLETVILKDPMAALEIPLLQKEVENLQETNDKEIAALQHSIQQISDFTIAIIVAMGIAILSMALSSVLKGRSSKVTQEDKEKDQ